MRVDAHQHFWRLARNDYGWLTADKAVIYRDFLPKDLEPLLAAAGIARTVLVQAAPTEAETEFLLELAAQTPFVAGVVGWLDFDAPDAALRVASMAERSGLLGLRPMIQDIPDVGWMLRPTLGSPLQAMARAGLVFDALVTPRHLPNLRQLLARTEGLAVVVDHGAKPQIERTELTDWARNMRRLAAETDAVCKLSGLATEAATGWRADDLRPYVDVLLESFGPGRLMWGSDWPVLNLNGSYGAWRKASETLLSGLSATDRDLIFGGVASRVYGIAS